MTDETEDTEPKPEESVVVPFPHKRTILQSESWAVWARMAQVCPFRINAVGPSQPLCGHGRQAPQPVEQRRILVPVEYNPFPFCEAGRCPLLKDLNV